MDFITLLKLIAMFAGAYIVADIIVKIKKKSKEKEEQSEHISVDSLNQLISQLNIALSQFQKRDNEIRELFKVKIAEFEENKSYDQTEELNEYIEKYNAIIARFDRKYEKFQEREIIANKEGEYATIKFIDQMCDLDEALKKLTLNLSRITFVKREEETSENVVSGKKEVPLYTFFTGKETIEKVKAKYRSLAKIYHPDAPTGDEEKFILLQDEYDDLLTKLASA